jgi:hypothetical protein
MRRMVIILLLFLLFCSSYYQTANNPTIKDNFFITDLNYRDFSLQKLEIFYYPHGLKLVDSLDYIYVLEREHCSSSEYYYYSIFDTTNYNSYVYYYYSEAKLIAFVLVNYDKNGKYIDDVCISSMSGDAGYFYHSDGIFINDSTIIRNDDEGYYKEFDNVPEFNELNKVDENDSIVFTGRCKLKIVLKKDGHIQTDTLQCK